jgi:hypothetical protein
MMWPRIVEIVIGLWVAASPLVFGHDPNHRLLWANDLVCGLAIISLAVVSFWQPLRRAHLGQLLVAGWMIGVGFFAAPPPTPVALQNEILVGMVLAMFAIIPSEANQPPRSWREFVGQASKGRVK